jgi:hypothetical protein
MVRSSELQTPGQRRSREEKLENAEDFAMRESSDGAHFVESQSEFVDFPTFPSYKTLKSLLVAVWLGNCILSRHHAYCTGDERLVRERSVAGSVFTRAKFR